MSCTDRRVKDRRAPRPGRRAFAEAVLLEAGLPHLPGQVRCLVAVMVGEGSQAHWNPMDTTRREAGAVPYNTFGAAGEFHVWDYPDARTGVEATVATLLQDNMRPWTDVLRYPRASASECCKAFEQVEWAYKGDRVPLEVVADWIAGRRSYVRDYSVPVAGPGAWPYRTPIL